MGRKGIAEYLAKLYKAGLIENWSRKSAASFLNPEGVELSRSDTLFEVFLFNDKESIVFWASDIKNICDINRKMNGNLREVKKNETNK